MVLALALLEVVLAIEVTVVLAVLLPAMSVVPCVR